jgi:hypothetical protein
MVVGDQRSFDGRSDEPVVQDSCGKGELSGRDSGVKAGNREAAVFFEGQLAFHRVKTGLDPLADATKFAKAWLLVSPVGSDEGCPKIIGNEAFEVPAWETLVGNDDVSGFDQVVVVSEECFGNFWFTDHRVDQAQTIGIPSGPQSR